MNYILIFFCVQSSLDTPTTTLHTSFQQFSIFLVQSLFLSPSRFFQRKDWRHISSPSPPLLCGEFASFSSLLSNNFTLLQVILVIFAMTSPLPSPPRCRRRRRRLHTPLNRFVMSLTHPPPPINNSNTQSQSTNDTTMEHHKPTQVHHHSLCV